MREQATAHGDRVAEQLKCRVRIGALGLCRQRRPVVGHRQPRRAGGEAVGRRGTAPRQRHPLAVAAAVGVPAALPGRVLQRVVGQVDVLQAQLVAVVEVDGARQRELYQRGGPGPRNPDRPAAVAGRDPVDVVIGQYPGTGRADVGERGERVVDRGSERRGTPRGHDQFEVEGEVEFVGADVERQALRVGHPGLADRHPVAGVGVEHPAEEPVELVHAVLVPAEVGGVGHVAALESTLQRRRRQVGQPGRLGHRVRDVDAEPVDAPVEPEPHHALELGRDGRVLPVQVGLFGREQVQVPVAVGQARPGRPAEHRRPVVGRFGAVSAAAGTDDEAVAQRGVTGHDSLEPRVFAGEVVGHHVDRHAHPARVCVLEQVIEVGERAEDRVDVAGVGDVVAAVGHR